MLEPEALIRRNQELVDRYGPWSWRHELAPGIYTREPADADLETVRVALVNRMVQVVGDMCAKPWSKLRVVDLACLEGHHAIAMARKGANSLGIEGREGHVEKARLLKEVFGLDNVEFVVDDVRNFGVKKYGQFDAVVCSGIFYHLDLPDVFDFLYNMSQACTRCLVLDTHVTFRPDTRYEYRGRTYHGSFYQEHNLASTAEQRIATAWASLDNLKSFWPTRSSLLNALRDVGFTSVYEPLSMFVPRPADRIIFIALKGETAESPYPGEPWPENPQPMPASGPQNS